jgi:hypothetical protein
MDLLIEPIPLLIFFFLNKYGDQIGSSLEDFLENRSLKMQRGGARYVASGNGHRVEAGTNGDPTIH